MVIKMTVANSKIKIEKSLKKLPLTLQEISTLTICFIMGVGIGRSSWSDISLAFASLILLQQHCKPLQKTAVLGGELLCLGFMSVKNSNYLPYFLSCVIYIFSLNVLHKRENALLPAVIFMAVSKIILVYFNYSWQYKVYAVLEAVVVYVISDIIKDGKDFLETDMEISSFTDAFSVAWVIAIPTAAFSGFDAHWIYPGAAFTVALSWLYMEKGKISHSFLCIAIMILNIADKRAFLALLAVLSAVSVIGYYFVEKFSRLIYPFVIAVSVVGNLIFIDELNSFVAIGTCVHALIMYTILPHILNFKRVKTFEIYSNQKDYRQLMISLEKLKSSLNFLGTTVMDISLLNEKNLTGKNIEDMVAEEICSKCRNNIYCWQEKYSFTCEQFSKYSTRMYWNVDNDFAMPFYGQCINVDKLKKSFEENSKLYLTKKYILQSRKNNQKLLQSAFMSISSAVGDMLYQNQTSRLVNTSLTMQMSNFLKDLGTETSYCLCSQNPDKVTFSLLAPAEETQLYKIKNKIEDIYAEKFSDCDLEIQGVEYIYSFCVKTFFDYDFTVKSRRYGNVNGDSAEVFKIYEKLYVIISDGMGTGPRARAESMTAVAMAKSLLSADVSVLNVINIVNLSLNLKGYGESGASLDILCVNLLDGKASVTKAGAGQSVLISKDDIKLIYKNSLPLGVLKDIKAEKEEFEVTSGDIIIMMSDGVAFEKSKFDSLLDKKCENIAEELIENSFQKDDKTVIVIKF